MSARNKSLDEMIAPLRAKLVRKGLIPDGQEPSIGTYNPRYGYRVRKGHTIGRDGQRKEKVWYLGHDAGEARFKAIVERHYRMLKAGGLDHWTDERVDWLNGQIELLAGNIRDAYAEAVRLHDEFAPFLPVEIPQALGDSVRLASFPTEPRSAPAPTPAAASPLEAAQAEADRNGQVLSLHAALDSYSESVQEKTTLSTSYRTRCSEAVSALKHYLDDCPLSAIDRRAIEKQTDLLKARPTSRHSAKKKA